MSEGGLTRRSALAAAGVAGVGAVAGYAAGRKTDAAQASPPASTGGGGYGGSSGRASDRPLAKVADIPDGGGVIIDNPAVVITRTGSQIHAFSSVCTHQGCVVNKVANGTIDCPCHGSRFDATSGAVVAGPAPSPLPPVRVTIRTGEVFPA